MRKYTLVAADTHEDILCRSFQRTTLAGTHWRARAARCVLLAGARIVASGESPSARFSCCTHCRCCHPRCRCCGGAVPLLLPLSLLQFLCPLLLPT